MDREARRRREALLTDTNYLKVRSRGVSADLESATAWTAVYSGGTLNSCGGV